ncbi:MAG TPA: DUF6518 family protein [Candidatus Limnocylindria bacterium]|nr:DUF6518 family protein [Candidatus Limnocylindria bacterium]
MTERRSLGSYALLALVAGLALGLFSGLGDWVPADTVLHVVVALANAAGPWLVTAFVVGALAGAPLAGAITASAALVAALAVYYLTIYAIGYTVADLTRSAGVWLAVAVVVGPLLGAAGGAWARPRRPFDRIGAVALLAGALAAEAILRLIQVQAWTGLDLARTDVQVGLIELAAAVVLPAVLLAPGERLRGYLGTAIVTVGAAILIAGALAVIRWALLG